MDKVKEYRDRLKVLRGQKNTLDLDIRAKRDMRKGINTDMVLLRIDIKREKAKKNEVVAGQVDQPSAQKTE